MPHTTPVDGLFDLQVNGFGGVDFQSIPSFEDAQIACARLHECGMRRILATFITDDSLAIQRKLRAFESYRERDPVIQYHCRIPS